MSAEQKPNRPESISETEATLLSRPRVVLYANRSPESDEAFKVLEQAEIGFAVIPSPRRKVPVAKWAGYSFKGVTEVRELAGALQDFKTVLVGKIEESMPGYFEHPDTALQQFQDLRSLTNYEFTV